MTAEPREFWILACDACGDPLTDPDYENLIVEATVERLRKVAAEEGWSRRDDEDICASCTCVRTGHDRRVSTSGTFAYCGRCGETLIGATTAAPNPAFL